MKADPDDGQSAHHAQKAGVELCRHQEALQRIARMRAGMNDSLHGVLISQV